MMDSVRTDYFLVAYRRARGENQNKHSNMEDDDDDDDDNNHHVMIMIVMTIMSGFTQLAYQRDKCAYMYA